jgi:WD40 repeat protein
MFSQTHKLFTLAGHRDSVYALAIGASAHEVFSAGTDGFVVKWDLANTGNEKPPQGQLVAQINASVYSLCFVKEKNRLVIGENYDGLHLIDLMNNREIASSSMTKSAIFAMVYLKEILFVGCGDGLLAILNINDLSTIKRLQFSTKSVRCLALNPVKNELAIGYSDNFIRVIDLEALKIKYQIQAHTNSVFSLCYSPDFQFLLSGSRDAHLKVWSVNQNYELHRDIVAHLFTINSIAYSPKNQYFATCSKDKSIKIWRADDFKLLKVIDKSRHAGHGTSVNKLVWTTFHHSLLACSDDKSISVWQLE